MRSRASTRACARSSRPAGHFPSDDAVTKLIWLALRNITADWGRAAKDWKEAMNQFAIFYEDRFTKAAA
jgi:putative transposase